MAPQCAGGMGFGRLHFQSLPLAQGRRRCDAAVRAVAMSAFLAGLSLSAAPANAACAPDPASSGQTVICSDNTPGGFQAGFGVSNLTVNVLSGATLSDGGGGAAISVMDSNTVNNAGTVTAGAFSNGILALTDDNTVNNLVSGTITVGHDSPGISVQGPTTQAPATRATLAPGLMCLATTRGLRAAGRSASKTT